MPTPQPDEPGLARDVPIHVGCHFRGVTPGMEHRAVHGATPGFARRWGGVPQLHVDAQAAQQGILRGRRGKLLLGGMPTSTTSRRLLGVAGKSAKTRATASS